MLAVGGMFYHLLAIGKVEKRKNISKLLLFPDPVDDGRDFPPDNG